jgi:hypothetical protein
MTDSFLSPTSAALAVCREYGDVERVLDEVRYVVQVAGSWAKLVATALRRANALLVVEPDDVRGRAMAAFAHALDVEQMALRLVLEIEDWLATGDPDAC